MRRAVSLVLFLKRLGGGDSRGTWRHVAKSDASKDCEDRFADAHGAHPAATRPSWPTPP